MKTRVLDNQSLLDVAIKDTGTISSAFDIALSNGIGITDELPANSELNLPGKDYGFKAVIDYFRRIKKNPATGIDNPETLVQPSGIGYWAIGTTFKVS
ncbi:MAG: hypothetical protein U1C58_06320 [Flavobacteriaceae bacterium]|nr:hypothetical protein [Flavobacteriaceae bacterium]